MVGRLVQQQQVGSGEQRGGKGNTHPPPARELRHRPNLSRLVKSQPRQNRRRPGGRRIGPDGYQPVVDFRQTVRVGGLGLRQQRQPFRVALQHGIEQGYRPLRRFLANSRDARTRRQTYVSTVEGDLTGDSAEQRRFSSPIASHKTNPASRIDREVGFIQQRTTTQSDDSTGDNKERHNGGLALGTIAGKHCRDQRAAGPLRVRGEAASNDSSPRSWHEPEDKPPAPTVIR